MPVPPTFAILCVCTGNVCRSPATERLLRHTLGPSVAVWSAGTDALVGRPMEPEVSALLAKAGVDADGFEARNLTLADVSGADLILAMTREHRGAVVELAPSSIRRVFTLRELARILQSVEPSDLPGAAVQERLRAAVPLAGSRRRRAAPDEDDVPDPYRGSPERHRSSFDAIARAVATIAAAVATSDEDAQPARQQVV